MLGATVVVGGVYWYYDEYTDAGEAAGMDMATKVGLKAKLTALVGTGELCPPVKFTLVNGGKEIHVSIDDYSGTKTGWYITAWYAETSSSWLGGIVSEVKYLIRREDNYRVFPDPTLCCGCN